MQQYGNETDIMSLEPLNFHDLETLEQIRDSFEHGGPRSDVHERKQNNLQPFDYNQLAFKLPTANSPIPLSPLNQVDFNDFSAIQGQRAFDMSNVISSPPTPSGAITPLGISTPDLMGPHYHMSPFNNVGQLQKQQQEMLQKQTQQLKSQQQRIQQLEAMLHPSQIPFVPNQVPSPAPQWFTNGIQSPHPFDSALARPMTPELTITPQKYPSSNFNFNGLQPPHPGVTTPGLSMPPKQVPSDWLQISQRMAQQQSHHQRPHHQRQHNQRHNHNNISNNDNKIGGKKEKVKKKRKYDWDVFQLQDYADALLSMMPRTVFSRHREKNNAKSSWYTYNVKAGMYVREQTNPLQSYHVLPPRNLSHDEFYRRFNSKYQELLDNAKERAISTEKTPEEKEVVEEAKEVEVTAETVDVKEEQI